MPPFHSHTLMGSSGQSSGGAGSDAGKTNATHFYKPGDSGGTDLVGSMDLTLINGTSAGTTETVSTIAGMTSARVNTGTTARYSSSAGSSWNWSADDAFIGMFINPTDDNNGTRKFVEQGLNNDDRYLLWFTDNYSGDYRYDYPNPGYGSRYSESTSWASGGVSSGNWHYIRFGRHNADLRLEVWTHTGSAWPGSPNTNLTQSSGAGSGPAANQSNSVISVFGAMWGSNRSIKGKWGNFGFYRYDGWGTAVPST